MYMHRRFNDDNLYNDTSMPVHREESSIDLNFGIYPVVMNVFRPLGSLFV